MSLSLSLLKSPDHDVRKWITPLKLSYGEVCEKFGIDINNDRRNSFFWNMMLDKKILIDDKLLSWCGYSGEYRNMKTNFLSLLKKNPHLKYNEIEDANYRKKRYIVMDTLDFESLLMQMRSRKAQEIRELYSFLKHISMQYIKYEKYYEEHRNELISAQNNQLTQSVCELKDLVLQVKSNADREIERAEQDRIKAEEDRMKAEQERFKAEEDRMKAEQERFKAEEERQRAEKRHLTVSTKLDTMRKRIRTEVVDRLRTEIAPLVAPQPINRGKDRCLALICLRPTLEWYIVRRQRESFNKAINAVLKKNSTAKLVREWHGLAHSVDIGNCVKLRLRNLKWLARGNILRVIVDDDIDSTMTTAGDGCQRLWRQAEVDDPVVVYTDDDIVDTINDILNENSALHLSEHTETLLIVTPESSQ